MIWTMNFFTNLKDALFSPSISDPVQGTAQVVSASMPPSKNGGGAMCEMSLVVTIPGQPSVAVRKANLVSMAKWPMPGMSLPVVAERSDPGKFRILWDQVASGRERGLFQAQQVADRLNGNGGEAAGGAAAGLAGLFGAGIPAGVRTSVTINGRPASAQDLSAFEAMTGMDLNGDGVVGGTVTDGAGKADAEAGSVDARLRRLQGLRDAGLINEDEFQAKRAEILSRL